MKERYGLSNEQFSIALDRIQENREMRSALGIESELLHLTDDDIVSVVEQWRRLHPPRKRDDDDLGLDYFDTSRFEAMSDVARNERGPNHAQTQWWWHIPAGKGQKPRFVPLHDEAMQALRDYRQSLGLAALPHTNEDNLALIWGVRGPERHRGINRSTLFRLTKRLLLAAAATVKGTDPSAAQKLCEASTHWWLRHSTATNALDAGVELRAVQQLMGHANIQTTMRYVHDDDKAFPRKTRRPSAWTRTRTNS